MTKEIKVKDPKMKIDKYYRNVVICDDITLSLKS